MAKNQNTKTETLLGIVTGAIATGQYQIEPAQLAELFTGDTRASVFVRVPGQYRGQPTGRAKDLKPLHQVVREGAFDDNFKGIVAKAYRQQFGHARDQAEVPGRSADGGKSADQAVRALGGRLTRASSLPQPDPTRRTRADMLLDGAGRVAATTRRRRGERGSM